MKAILNKCDILHFSPTGIHHAHSSTGANSTTSGPRPGSNEGEGISCDDGGELRSSTRCQQDIGYGSLGAYAWRTYCLLFR